MDIKKHLKDSNTTQEEFSEYVGMSRGALNVSLNKGDQKQSLVNSLKLKTLEDNGVTVDLEEGKIHIDISL